MNQGEPNERSPLNATDSRSRSSKCSRILQQFLKCIRDLCICLKTQCQTILQQFLKCMGVTSINLVYFIIVFSFGIVLALSVAINKPSGINENYIHYFFSFFMIIGVLWMFCTCLCQRSPFGCCVTRREMVNQIPGYVFCGLTIFCIGSCFVTMEDFVLFIFTQNCDDEKLNKNTATSEGVYNLVKFAFIIIQFLFFYRFSGNAFHYGWFTSFFFLLNIAVNLTTWVYFIVDEYEEHSSTDYLNCAALNKINKFVLEADMFLYPFNIEYSIMSSVLLFLMWFELKKKKTHQGNQPQEQNPNHQGNQPQEQNPNHQGDQPQEQNRNHQANQAQEQNPNHQGDQPQEQNPNHQGNQPQEQNPNHQGNQPQEQNPNHQGNQPQEQNLNHQQIKGTIFGIAFGIGILIFIAVLIALTAALQNTHIPSVKAYYGSRIFIFLVLAIACIFGLKFVPQPRPTSQSKVHTRVDSILIMIGASGCYVMTFFETISAISDQHTGCPQNDTNNNNKSSSNNSMQYCEYLGLFIADNVVCLFQFSLQAVFTVKALRCGSEEVSQVTRVSFVRNACVALIFANVGIWFMDTIELKEIQTLHTIEISAYGKSTWQVLVHIFFPLCVFFRLHSAFCFIEIVINRFGVTAQPRLENYGPTNSSVQAQQTASSV